MKRDEVKAWANGVLDMVAPTTDENRKGREVAAAVLALDTERVATEAKLTEALKEVERQRGLWSAIRDHRVDAAEVREKALREALEACLKVLPCLEVHNWPPGWRLKDEALRLTRAALAGPGKKG